MRSIDRLSDGQLELRWDHLVIRLRPVDLLVLHQTLLRFAEATGQEWTSDHCIELGPQIIMVQSSEFAAFAEMVYQAAEALPRRVVHWSDISVRINPIQKGTQIAHLSLN